jgi:hypothetical protein
VVNNVVTAGARTGITACADPLATATPQAAQKTVRNVAFLVINQDSSLSDGSIRLSL